MESKIQKIHGKVSARDWYRHELRFLNDYAEHGDDEEIIKDYKCKIKEYEKCIKKLQRDIILIDLGFE